VAGRHEIDDPAPDGLANSQGVTVDYLVATRDSRLIIVIVTSALLGAVISRLLRRRRD